MEHPVGYCHTSSPLRCPCRRLLANLRYVVVDEGHVYKGAACPVLRCDAFSWLAL